MAATKGPASDLKPVLKTSWVGPSSLFALLKERVKSDLKRLKRPAASDTMQNFQPASSPGGPVRISTYARARTCCVHARSRVGGCDPRARVCVCVCVCVREVNCPAYAGDILKSIIYSPSPLLVSGMVRHVDMTVRWHLFFCLSSGQLSALH